MRSASACGSRSRCSAKARSSCGRTSGAGIPTRARRRSTTSTGAGCSIVHRTHPAGKYHGREEGDVARRDRRGCARCRRSRRARRAIRVGRRSRRRRASRTALHARCRPRRQRRGRRRGGASPPRARASRLHRGHGRRADARRTARDSAAHARGFCDDRLQDRIDLRSLAMVAGDAEWANAATAARTIRARGFHRGRALATRLRRWRGK